MESLTLNAGDELSIPNSWKNTVKLIADGEGKYFVLPNGFFYVGGSVDTGVVISDKKNDSIIPSESEGNQFVWIPVQDTIYDENKTSNLLSSTNYVEVNTFSYTPMAKMQSESTNNYMGILYDFSNGKAKYETSYTLGQNTHREPSLVTGSDQDLYALLSTIGGTLYDNGIDSNNIKYYTYVGNYKSAKDFGKSMQEDFNKMIESVNKYGGFYVGRYETGANSGVAQSKYGKSVTTHLLNPGNWYGLYKIQMDFSTNINNKNIRSSMIWGCQYDQMMLWITRTGTIINTEIFDGYNKNATSNTGSCETDKLNNIYDLCRDGMEWTQEAYKENYRGARGGFYAYNYGSYCRFINNYNIEPTAGDSNKSSRTTFYIK